MLLLLDGKAFRAFVCKKVIVKNFVFTDQNYFKGVSCIYFGPKPNERFWVLELIDSETADKYELSLK